MMRKEVILIFLVFAVFGIIFAGAEKVDNGKIDSKVTKRLQTEERVNVFVKFKDDNGKGVMGADLRNKIDKKKIKYEFKGMVSASLTKEDIELLEQDDSVEKIEEVGVRQITLSDSTVQINATSSWRLQYNGLNLTGAGETICVIDTGINYSHSSLGGCWGNNDAYSECKVLGGYDYVNSDANPYDDNGHGTHVSGIAAANGTITGVAPGAKIVMLKACNAAGSCSDADLIASISWCVNNATLFNISVISMSIGGGSYNDYCDSSDSLTPYINDAYANNISFIAAAGNTGNLSEIMAPACVQNATAVGSIRKNDATFDYKRNWLVKLIAPGVSITSTSITGGSVSSSGTSMATPHVAGAFAIANQLLRAQQRVKTPKQIEEVFNNTGRRITDSRDGLNYSRIDVYNALISLDSRGPAVGLMIPANNTGSGIVNWTFRCNATDLLLKNVTFYLWNSSSVYNQTFSNASGSSFIFELNITNIPLENYKWNCLFTDAGNNATFAPANYSLTIGDYPFASLTSPANGLKTKESSRTFVCNATSQSELKNVTFYLWNSTGIENITSRNISGTDNGTSFDFNFAYDDSYEWNCLFVNSGDLTGKASANYSITYDTANPKVTMTSPTATTYTTSSYNINIALDETGYCEFSLNGGATNESLTANLSNTGFTGSKSSISNGNYLLWAYCNDTAGNRNDTMNVNFTVSVSAGGGNNGGGGGGGGGGSKSVTTVPAVQTAPAVSPADGGTTSSLPAEKPKEQVSFSPPENVTAGVWQKVIDRVESFNGWAYFLAGAASIGAVWLIYKKIFGLTKLAKKVQIKK